MKRVFVLSRRSHSLLFKLPMDGTEILIGSSQNCHIVIGGQFVSDIHAKLRYFGEKWLVKKMGEGQPGLFKQGLEMGNVVEELEVGQSLGFGVDKPLTTPDVYIFRLMNISEHEADSHIGLQQLGQGNNLTFAMMGPKMRKPGPKRKTTWLPKAARKGKSSTSRDGYTQYSSSLGSSVDRRLSGIVLGTEISTVNLVKKERRDLIKGLERGSPGPAGPGLQPQMNKNNQEDGNKTNQEDKKLRVPDGGNPI